MTVIAWDGRYMAADRMLEIDGFASDSEKLVLLQTGVVFGSAGAARKAEAMIEWLKKEDRKIKDFSEDKADADILVYDKTIKLYNDSPYPINIIDNYSIGCGHEIARTAMHLGKNAMEACAIACQINIYCGLGIDYVDTQNIDKGIQRYGETT